MSLLTNAQSMQELKGIYRKLAAIHHPDKGGCERTMQRLNELYQLMQERLKLAANDPNRSAPVNRPEPAPRCDFSKIQVGDRLYINSTLSEVIGITSESFRAKALGRSRQSVFCKQSGIGLFNKRLRASYQPIPRPSYH